MRLAAAKYAQRNASPRSTHHHGSSAAQHISLACSKRNGALAALISVISLTLKIENGWRRSAKTGALMAALKMAAAAGNHEKKIGISEEMKAAWRRRNKEEMKMRNRKAMAKRRKLAK